MNTNPDPKAEPLKDRKNARRLDLMDCFAKGTWTAFGLAAVFLGIDVFAMFRLPHHRFLLGQTHGPTFFAITLWSVEIALGLLGLWLVRFAFSRPPRLDPQS